LQCGTHIYHCMQILPMADTANKLRVQKSIRLMNMTFLNSAFREVGFVLPPDTVQIFLCGWTTYTFLTIKKIRAEASTKVNVPL